MSEEKLKWQEAVLFLKDRGITTVKVHYEGSGDSGSIDSISYYKGEDEHNIKDLDISDEMHEKLINLCYPMLDNIEDWYNNDGGHGTLSIDIKTGEYEIDVNIEYRSYSTHNHEGNIIED